MSLMCQCYAKLQFFVCSYSSLSWIGLQYVPDFSSVPAKSYKTQIRRNLKRCKKTGMGVGGGGGGKGWKRFNDILKVVPMRLRALTLLDSG